MRTHLNIKLGLGTRFRSICLCSIDIFNINLVPCCFRTVLFQVSCQVCLIRILTDKTRDCRVWCGGRIIVKLLSVIVRSIVVTQTFVCDELGVTAFQVSRQCFATFRTRGLTRATRVVRRFDGCTVDARCSTTRVGTAVSRVLRSFSWRRGVHARCQVSGGTNGRTTSKGEIGQMGYVGDCIA